MFKFTNGTSFPWSVPNHVEITTVCSHKGLLIEALHRFVLVFFVFFNFRAIDICWSRRRSNMMQMKSLLWVLQQKKMGEISPKQLSHFFYLFWESGETAYAVLPTAQLKQKPHMHSSGVFQAAEHSSGIMMAAICHSWKNANFTLTKLNPSSKL